MGNRMKSVFIFMLIFSLFSCRYSKTVGSHHCDEYVDYKFPADYREKKQSLEEMGNLQDVNDFTMDLEGNFYFLENGCRIKKFDPEMNFIAQIYPKEGEQIQLLTGQKIAVDHHGNFYVYDSEFKGLGHCYRPKIKKISSQGKMIDFFWGGESKFDREIKIIGELIFIPYMNILSVYDLNGIKKETIELKKGSRILNVIKKDNEENLYLLYLINQVAEMKHWNNSILLKLDKKNNVIESKVIYQDDNFFFIKAENKEEFLYFVIQKSLIKEHIPYFNYLIKKYDLQCNLMQEWVVVNRPAGYENPEKQHIVPEFIFNSLLLKNKIYVKDHGQAYFQSGNKKYSRIFSYDLENQKMTVLKEWLY